MPDSFPIPDAAFDDCGAILGRRGAGKSALKMLMFEHELDRGRRCFQIDPKGDSWGFRLDPDGTPSRFKDVPIFGGLHGDIALTDTMGEQLGRLVATTDLSGALDLSSFSTAGMRRFMRDFAEALFENNRAPLTLFVDEADQLAPQTVPGEMAKLLHHMERLIRQGRQRGIFMWMLTQRPAVLNNNLLSQAETLVAMKMSLPHDRRAIRNWMDAHDPAMAKHVDENLSKLSVGEAFAWIPGADFLERVQFPMFSTFDSGRTPKHGEQVLDVKLEKLDMAEIAAALAGADEANVLIPAPSNEGPNLKRIADLEAQVARLKTQEREAYERGRVAGVAVGIARARMALDALRIPVIIDAIPAQGDGGPPGDEGPPSEARAPREPEPHRESSDGAAKGVTGRECPPRQKRILNALAWAETMLRGHAVERNIVAWLAGTSPKSSGYEKDLGAMRTAGLVDYPAKGTVALTDTGRAQADTPDRPLTKRVLLDAIKRRLEPRHCRLLDAMWELRPEPAARPQLANKVGSSAQSSGFEKDLGRLRTLGLLDYPAPGMVSLGRILS